MVRWLPLVFCALAVFSGMAVPGLSPEIHPKVETAGLDAHETHASASLLGQFRTNLTGWLWLRTDLYLHNGVEMRPLTDAEHRAGGRGASSSDGLHVDDGFTVIPSAKRDFRGVLGDIERATRTYKNMENHVHNDPMRAMPLYRLMTWVDPNFVEGWRTGGAVLGMSNDPTRHAMAVAFLQQGLTENPDSITILAQLGFTFTAKSKDYRKAIATFERARAVARRSKTLGQEDTDSLLQSYRWLTLLYRDTHEPEKQVAIAQEAIKVFPGDPVLERSEPMHHSDHDH